MPVAETTIPIDLGGKTYEMVFNANSMCAYERATGKFYLDTVATLYDALTQARKGREIEPGLSKEEILRRNREIGMEVMRKVSMSDLRALLWSSLHVYDSNGEPRWLFSLNQVGREISMLTVPRIFMAFINGQSSNSPSREEMGESPARPESGEVAREEEKIGGVLSTESLEAALGSES